MAKRETLDQLVAAVAHAELIPAGRALTVGEIELLDDLAARLRKQFFGDRSEEIRDLLRRVSAVRTGKRDTTAATPSPTAATPKSKPKKPAKPKTPSTSTHKHSIELRRIAQAGRPISKADAEALDRIVADLEALSRTQRRARMLWTQALDTRAYLTGGSAAPDRDRSGVPSAGRVGRSRGLDSAKREVLGGLPGTRRGH